MQYGFIKAAAVSPALRVADCAFNAQELIRALQDAHEQGVQLLCTPELGITGYTCGDLFLQEPLLQGAKQALRRIVQASAGLDPVLLVGLPLLVEQKLYNCAAVVHDGAVLGFVPKTHLPNYAEFYELRHFTPAPAETVRAAISAAASRVLRKKPLGRKTAGWGSGPGFADKTASRSRSSSSGGGAQCSMDS